MVKFLEQTAYKSIFPSYKVSQHNKEVSIEKSMCC